MAAQAKNPDPIDYEQLYHDKIALVDKKDRELKQLQEIIGKLRSDLQNHKKTY